MISTPIYITEWKTVLFSEFRLDQLELSQPEKLTESSQHHKSEIKALKDLPHNLQVQQNFQVVPSTYQGQSWVMEFPSVQGMITKNRMKENETQVVIPLNQDDYQRLKELQRAFFNQFPEDEKLKLKRKPSCLRKRIIGEGPIYELIVAKQGVVSMLFENQRSLIMDKLRSMTIQVKFKCLSNQDFLSLRAKIFLIVL